MEFLTGIFVIVLVGIVADTIAKVAKARAGARNVAALEQELEELRLQLQDQATALTSQSGQLAELQERVDFAERMLAQVRNRPALGAGRQQAWLLPSSAS